MEVDPSRFERLNVVDTCGVWNLVSSIFLLDTAIAGGCVFSCTGYVLYECLFKARKNVREVDLQLRQRLIDERRKGSFKDYRLDLEALLEVEVLEKRRKLGKGELSSIVFAKLTRQSLLTDDQGARKLSAQVLGRPAQTTPHLFGWLVYSGAILDHHKDKVIEEHSSFGRPLAKFLEEIYTLALSYRAASMR